MRSMSSNGGRPTYNQVLVFVYATSEREPRNLRRGSDLQQAAITAGLMDRFDVSEFHDALRSMHRDGLITWGRTYGQPDFDAQTQTLWPVDFANFSEIDLTADGRKLAQQVVDGVRPSFGFIPHVDAPPAPLRPNLDAHAAAAETSIRGKHFDQAVVSACSLLEAACRDCLVDGDLMANKPSLKQLATHAARAVLGIEAGAPSPLAKVASSIGGAADALSIVREAHGRSVTDHKELTEAEALLCDAMAVALARYLSAVSTPTPA